MALCDEEWEEDPARHEARMGLMRNVYNDLAQWPRHELEVPYRNKVRGCEPNSPASG
jgi:hypothetical protein